MRVTNAQFLQAIFGDSYIYSHCTSFVQDPGNIPAGESGRCWSGGYYKDTPLIPDSNQFYTVSLFAPDENGKSRRRKVQFSGTYVIGLDDVKEKLPLEQVSRLPPPSVILKSSLHSEQWLYILSQPEQSRDRIDNLHDGLIKNGLAPNSKDPGQKGVTRFLRLPESVNTKAKRIAENGGTPPRCEVTEWHPKRRYTLEQLAAPFSVDLDIVRADKRINGAATVSDHPLINIPGTIHIKELRSDGRYEIRCPWMDEHTDNDDSGSAIFTNSDGSIGFRCHHGSCDDRTGRDLLQYVESQSPGFNEKLKQWQVIREFTGVTPSQEATPVKTILTAESPLNALLATAANGDSLKMKQQMSADKFVLKDLAILGQWTVFYAGPNTGKTLLTLWMLREAILAGQIAGIDVFYSNCDDTYKGGVEKLEIAEQIGYNMLLPNVRGFKPDTLLTTMKAMAVHNEASGKVIILDTLKKFTDLMDKRVSSQFGDIARSFVSAGGSLICLAHVNKHKNTDGKSVYTGTADIRDDADCVYTIEHIGSTKGFCSTTHTVEFDCNKSRGDVADKAAFQYTKEKGAGYHALIDSVKRVSSDVAESAQQAAQADEEHKIDADAIEQIKCAITNGETTKTKIETFVVSTSDVSHRRTRSVLNKYEGRLWSIEKGSSNASLYSLIVAPVAPENFL